ncbi:MAG: DUF58 domain-containing protein [Micavibrio sp.]
MGNGKSKLDTFFHLLAGVDETYRKIPMNMRLEIEKISQGLSEFGPRKLHRRGAGTEFFESRDFRPDVDEAKRINARLSARAGRPVVIEKEAEIRQHFYLWRDSTKSMDYTSGKARYNKKQSAEIMLLAFAKHLARNEELIGILDGRGVYRGGKASEQLAHQMMNVTIMGGDMPVVARKLPQHSTVVLFGDFLMNPDELAKRLGNLNGLGLTGYMVMVLDPQEIDFKFKGHMEFDGMEGEGKKAFKKTETMQAVYQEKMLAHIDALQKLCVAKGFKFILQRTDEPLHGGLMAIYGLSPKVPARAPSPQM